MRKPQASKLNEEEKEMGEKGSCLWCITLPLYLLMNCQGQVFLLLDGEFFKRYRVYVSSTFCSFSII